MRTTAQRLDRVLFETSRAAEYFSVTELQAQTGQPVDRFGDVVLKELLDNDLDECEKHDERTPQITVDVEWRADGGALLRVHDNGSGLPPDAVTRILNFDTRTSDKAAYRAPTRGLQGNALKTIIGMPTALSCAEPIIITACGVRHTIAARTDPAGRVAVQHTQDDAGFTMGTTVEVVLPAAAWMGSHPQSVCSSAALFNPHARVHFRPGVEDVYVDTRDRSMQAHLYTPLVAWPKEWRKWLPTDPTSPWWYDPQALLKLVYAHIGHSQEGGRDLPLGEFVRQFRGLRRTNLAKQVCAMLPGIGHLSDLEGRPDCVAILHGAMRHATGKPPSPDVLGVVGKEPLRMRMAVDDRPFWYEKRGWLTEDGVPWAAEVAIAVRPEHERASRQFGLNYSPALDDPLAGTLLEPDHEDIRYESEGLVDLLDTLHVVGSAAPHVTFTAVHLISPALDLLDRGKARLRVDEDSAEIIATMIARAARALYKEGEKKRARLYGGTRRDARPPRSESPTFKEAFARVIEEAYAQAIGGMTHVPARTVAYQVRPRIQQITDRPMGQKFMDYITQTLIPDYQRDHPGALLGVTYEPRGFLVEPHTHRRLPLGTREVEAYAIPPHTYNKICIIEKKGLLPVLQEAQLGERYDMALIASEGYATTAARTLLARADQHERYKIYVLHDADWAGYLIARALREETRRMPGYAVDVVDLGLFFDNAVARRLATEKRERVHDLPADLELTPHTS